MKIAFTPGRSRPARLLAKVALFGAAVSLPATGHVLSVSHGSLLQDGSDLLYELRMPLSEVPEDDDRARILLGAFLVLDGDQPGDRVDGKCNEDAGQGLFLCTATYRFPDPPKAVAVRCEFPAVTVPQHVHVLRSGDGEMVRQTVFDITYTEAEIRFTPPTWRETVATESGAGFRRALTSPELLLFLLALALAGRSKPEFAACAGGFLAAQALVAVVGGMIALAPPVRFLEAAAALTVAYLAAEILFLPDASMRWLACGAMGTFHGLFFATLLGSAQMSPAYFLPGALAGEGLALALLGSVRLRYIGSRTEQLGAILLLVGGLGWFGLRVIQ